MSSQKAKAKEFPQQETEDIIKGDKLLSNTLREGKEAIESFMKKKYKRYKTYIQKKEIYNKKMDGLNLQRKKEELIFEKEIYFLKLEDEIEKRFLKKKLRLKGDEEMPLKGDEGLIIPLLEDSDEASQENDRKKRRRELFK